MASDLPVPAASDDQSGREISTASVNNYLKGGSDHFRPDREGATRIMAVEPHIALLTQQNVRFGHRVVRHLAEQHGVEQFVDLGCGLPAEGTPLLHEVAWAVNPAVRVVYVDNDPAVLAHVRALVSGDERTAYWHGDVRDVDGLFSSDQFGILDREKPIAFLSLLVFHFLSPTEDPAGLIDELAARATAGGYIALSHVSHESFDAAGRVAVQAAFDEVVAGLVYARTREEVAALFGDRELIDPGVVDITGWRPDRSEATTKLKIIGGVAHLVSGRDVQL